MDSSSQSPSEVSQSPSESSEVGSPAPATFEVDKSGNNLPSFFSSSGISSWAKNLKLPQSLSASQGSSQTENSGMASLARITSGIGIRFPPTAPGNHDVGEGSSGDPAQSNVLGSLARGFLDSSKGAVKAVQTKARHMVSQNKRRYREGGFDLDLTYITENIIAMGFPAGDMSSGLFGYFEGFYRNHMEEVIRFFETHHKDKYKVYNLCSERLYDASLFKGKVATFPFDDHNCPPIQLIRSFCESTFSWLKEDIENVVVVHCKAGMARTGLMISSLLLFLKFFPTAEEAMDYYNHKRCIDSKALVLPSQIRYVKYFESTLTTYKGECPPGRRCMLRGFRLHRCPYWIRPAITISNHKGVLFTTKKHPRTKDLMPEDFWFKSPKKGIMVFALPGEPGLTELVGDFKVHFHDRQGDFYCWLNTAMMENRTLLSTEDLDGFDKRKLPSPGFLVEIVMVDYEGLAAPAKANNDSTVESQNSGPSVSSSNESPVQFKSTTTTETSKKDEEDDVFSDSEGEETRHSNTARGNVVDNGDNGKCHIVDNRDLSTSSTNQTEALAERTEQLSLKADTSVQHSTVEAPGSGNPVTDHHDTETASGGGINDFKAMAADASVFTFGDDDDLESD
ncbi:hypothetical protein MLD38_029026 [Melastoma candidum]|uniref:Uncharacterized protein n=1 Tax=Melastoma candidum TaxID=119954 RepID=A0ACB9N2V8_9MYRT|nr:hypothetical protein MLD38_029026 [Melastoma candidum]